MYFVIENQTRPDGIVNTTTTSRSTFAAALSLYHDRYSKMCVNADFVSVGLLLCDADLNVVQHDVVETLYKPE